MKKRTYAYILTALLLVIASLTLYAATEQWRYDGWSIVYQVAADGTGGCAIYRISTNGTTSVVWLDKDGQEKYDRVMTQGPVISPIMYCNKKNGIAFSATEGSGTNQVVSMILVDKKLNETVTTVPGKNIMPGSYPYGSGATAATDKKGFFVIELSRNGVGATVVRYTYK